MYPLVDTAVGEFTAVVGGDFRFRYRGLPIVSRKNRSPAEYVYAESFSCPGFHLEKTNSRSRGAALTQLLHRDARMDWPFRLRWDTHYKFAEREAPHQDGKSLIARSDLSNNEFIVSDRADLESSGSGGIAQSSSRALASLERGCSTLVLRINLS